jgi:two-component system, NtrC family, response regulator HydG
MNILVVEDDTVFSSVISQLLRRWGHMVEVSITGKDALEKVKGEMFDLVLLDIYLPDTTGLELIPQLKDIRPKIGIVTMTGYSTEELEKEIRTMGIIYYMSKPFPNNELKEILDHIERKSGDTTWGPALQMKVNGVQVGQFLITPRESKVE